MSRGRRFAPLGLLSFILLAVAACDAEQNLVPPDWGLNRMIDQPRYVPFGEGEFFADGMAMRVPPAGTVPRTAAQPTLPLDLSLLQEGRRRFDVVCAPCHGILGTGESVVAANMPLVKPPSLHSDRLRNASDDHLHRVMQDGWGLMPAYGYQMDARQLQSVTGYIRALQMSQRTSLGALPQALQEEAMRELGP